MECLITILGVYDYNANPILLFLVFIIPYPLHKSSILFYLLYKIIEATAWEAQDDQEHRRTDRCDLIPGQIREFGLGEPNCVSPLD